MRTINKQIKNQIDNLEYWDIIAGMEIQWVEEGLYYVWPEKWWLDYWEMFDILFDYYMWDNHENECDELFTNEYNLFPSFI